MSNNQTPRRGVLLIVASPSGAGKTSLCRRLMADHGGLELSISMTTRAIRPGEVHGRDYHFVSHEEFQRLVDRGRVPGMGRRARPPLRHAARAPIDRALAEGRDVLFDIDWQGAAAGRREMPRGRGARLHPAAQPGGAAPPAASPGRRTRRR